MKRLINKIGFTLIETLVVVGVIAVLCAIAIPGIIQAKHGMDVLEANSTAKELFTAAQNRLTSMKTNGQLKDVAEKIGNDKQVISNHYYQSTGDDALRQYLLSDNIFSNVSGDYIVELNPLSGDILGVFYWAKDADLGEYLDSITEGDGINAALNKLTTADRKALAEEKLIGYYSSKDSDEATAFSGSYSFEPEIKVVNGNDLYLSVIQRDKNNIISNFDIQYLYVTLTFKDEHNRTNTIKLSDDDIANYTYDSNDEDLKLLFLLDSIDFNGNPFNKLDYLKKQGFDGNYLSQGDNITVTVSMVYDDGKQLINSNSANGTAKFNGLFGTKTDILTDSTYTDIIIWNIRHLRNLSKIDTVINNSYADRPISIIQTLDINGDVTTWDNKDIDELLQINEASALNPRRDKNSNECKGFNVIPTIILNTTIYSIDATEASGAVHTIKNIEINGEGLFYRLNCDVTGVTIINPSFTSDTGTAKIGVLAGSITSGHISGCSVFFDDQSLLNSNILKGNTIIGGLAGTVTGETSVSECFANIKVEGSTQIGGLFGYTGKGVTITNCYSSGTVTGQDCVGGFIGYADNTAITNCFTTSNVNGEKRTGGFVGYISIDNTDVTVKKLQVGNIYKIKNGTNYLKLDTTARTKTLTLTTNSNDNGTDFYYDKKSKLGVTDEHFLYAYNSATGEKSQYYIANATGNVAQQNQNKSFLGRILDGIKNFFDPDTNAVVIVEADNNGNYYIMNFHDDNNGFLELLYKIVKFLFKLITEPQRGFWVILQETFDTSEYSFLTVTGNTLSWENIGGVTEENAKFQFISNDEETSSGDAVLSNCYAYGKVNETAVSNDITVGGFTVTSFNGAFHNCFYLRDVNYNETFAAVPDTAGTGIGIHSQTESEWKSKSATAKSLIFNGTAETVKFQGWSTGLKYYWGEVPNPTPAS